MLPLIELIADPRTDADRRAVARAADRRAGPRDPGADALAPHRPRPRGDLRRSARAWPTRSKATLDLLVIAREDHGGGPRRAGGGEGHFAVPRRTAIVEGDADLEDEDLIAREDMVITVTHGGYVKRTPLATFRTAAPRRQGPVGHVDQGGGRRHPGVLRLDPHADAVLLVGRQGLQAEGLAPADRRADRPRQGLHQPLPDRAGRDHDLDPAAAGGRGGLGTAWT